jgi:pyrophosphatase PpaX
MPRPALLFDLDGTLIDSIGLLLECMQFAFEGREQAPTTAEWVAGIGTPLRTQLAEWCRDVEDVEAMVGRYREYQDLHLERLTTPFPDVLDTIRWARDLGYPTAIVTSKGKGMTGRSLDHVGLATAFDAVVTFEETTRHKPLPDPVFLALERLGASPDRALFVGDSPHDMHAGRAAGVGAPAGPPAAWTCSRPAPTPIAPTAIPDLTAPGTPSILAPNATPAPAGGSSASDDIVKQLQGSGTGSAPAPAPKAP